MTNEIKYVDAIMHGTAIFAMVDGKLRFCGTPAFFSLHKPDRIGKFQLWVTKDTIVNVPELILTH
jgi:hypothetical protein